MANATLKDIVAFFGRDPETGGFKSLGEFKAQWEQLTEDSQNQIKAGIGDGTLTY